MPSYGTFIDDVLASLGFVHDDRLWYRDSVLQNTIAAQAKLVGQTLSQDLGPAADGTAAQHKLTTPVVPVAYNQNPTDTDWAYLYFDLPSSVYDIPFDGGLAWVRYHRLSLPVNCKPSVAGAVFNRTTLGALHTIYGSTYQRPSEEQPYFARARSGDADRVYLFGVSPLITKVMVGIYASPSFLTVSFSDPMMVDDDKLYTLKRMVMEMAIWPLGIPQERLKNDGRDFEPNQVVNTRPIISVNDPAVLEPPSQQ